MPKIIIEKGNDKGKQILLSGRGAIMVGRDPKAQVTVSDSMVSRQHFKIFTKNDKYFLRDLGSSNGTLLNGKRVNESELREGDHIQIGETLMTFANEKEGTNKDPMIGKVVDGYRIHERVGRGGMGTVYRATQLSLNRVIAFKVLSHELVKDAQFIELFRKEARAAAQLNHPNVVGVFDVGKQKGSNTYYISMEFMPNGSIQDLIGRNLKLPVEEALPYFMDAARGLEYAHKRNIVHRDIKPDNLMMNEEGHVKIGDLGLAKNITDNTKEEGIFGTPHYIAPEQALGKDVDVRADLYALGGTFYRVFSGQTPFTGPSVKDIVRKQIKEKAKAINELAPEIPLEMCRIIHKLMEKDPNERYPSPTELLDDLQRFKHKLENPEADSIAIPAPPQHRTLITVMVMVLLLVAIGGVIHLMTSQNDGPIVDPITDNGDDGNGDDGNPLTADPAFVRWLSAKDHMTDKEKEDRSDPNNFASLTREFKALIVSYEDEAFIATVRAYCDPKIDEFTTLHQSLKANKIAYETKLASALLQARKCVNDQTFSRGHECLEDFQSELDRTVFYWNHDPDSEQILTLPGDVITKRIKKDLENSLVNEHQVIHSISREAWGKVKKKADATMKLLSVAAKNPETSLLANDKDYYDEKLQSLKTILQPVQQTWGVSDYEVKAKELLRSARVVHKAAHREVLKIYKIVDANFFTELDQYVVRQILPTWNYSKAIRWIELSLESHNVWKNEKDFRQRFGRFNPLRSEHWRTVALERKLELVLQRNFIEFLETEHLTPLRKKLKVNGANKILNLEILPMTSQEDGKTKYADSIAFVKEDGKPETLKINHQVRFGDAIGTQLLPPTGADAASIYYIWLHFMQNKQLQDTSPEACIGAVLFLNELRQSTHLSKETEIIHNISQTLGTMYNQVISKYGYKLNSDANMEILTNAKLARKKLIPVFGSMLDKKGMNAIKQFESYLEQREFNNAANQLNKVRKNKLLNSLPIKDYSWKTSSGWDAMRKKLEHAKKQNN